MALPLTVLDKKREDVVVPTDCIGLNDHHDHRDVSLQTIDDFPHADRDGASYLCESLRSA